LRGAAAEPLLGAMVCEAEGPLTRIAGFGTEEKPEKKPHREGEQHQ